MLRDIMISLVILLTTISISVQTIILYGTHKSKSEGLMYCGTGFFINKNGDMLTAGHVVRNKQVVTLWYKNYIYSGYVIEVDKSKDVALIYVPSINTGYLSLNLNFKKGPITLYGYPMPDKFGYTLKVSTGTGESTYNELVHRQTIDFSAISYPGNSGGPIVNSNGVIGVLTDGWVGTNYHEGFGTDIHGVLQLLNNNSVTYTTNNHIDKDSIVEVCS